MQEKLAKPKLYIFLEQMEHQELQNFCIFFFFLV